MQVRHHAFHVPAAHVEGHGDAALGVVALNLVGAVHQIHGRHLLQRNLRAVGGGDKEPAHRIDVLAQVGPQAQHHVEAALLLEHLAGGLAGEGRLHGAVHILHVQAKLGEAVAVERYHNLGQAGHLLGVDVGGPRYLAGQRRRLPGVAAKLGQVLAVDFHHHVLLHPAAQLIEAHLNGLLEAERDARNHAHGLRHLVGQLLLGCGRGPFAFIFFEHHHQVSGFHRHRVSRDFRRAHLAHYLLHFGKLLKQNALGLLGAVHCVAQRAAHERAHLGREVAFRKRRDKLAAQGAKQQPRAHEQGHRRAQHQRFAPQGPQQQRLVAAGEKRHHPVREVFFMLRVAAERQRRHHRHVSQTQDKSPQNGKGHGLGHGPEHLALGAHQSQQRQVHNQDDDFTKRGRRADFAGGLVGFLVHLVLIQAGGSRPLPTVQPVHNGFHDNHGPVHDQPEVDGAQTEQVARHPEHAHQADGKQHGQRNDRGHHQPGPPVAQEQHQHQNHNQRALGQVLGHRADGPAHQLGAVQVHVDDDALGQGFLDRRHARLHGLNHLVGVGTLEHEHHPAGHFAGPVARHGPVADSGAQAHVGHVAYQHGQAGGGAAHHDVAQVGGRGGQALGADEVGLRVHVEVGPAGVLVVARHGLVHLVHGHVQGA